MRTLILALFLATAATAQDITVRVKLPPPRPAVVEAPAIRYDAPAVRFAAPVILEAPPVYLAAPVYRVYAAPVLVGPPITGPWYLGKRADLRRMGW